MRPRHLLAVAACLLTSVLAHADTISTFDLTGFTFWYGTTVTGQVAIDTTTGVAVSGTATAVYSGTTYNLPVVSSSFADPYSEIRFSQPSGSTSLLLVLPVNSLVGYTGGPVCTTGTFTCPTPNLKNQITPGDFFTATSVDIESAGSLLFDSSVTTTPEPSSLGLLATGLLSAAGLARKRLLGA